MRCNLLFILLTVLGLGLLNTQNMHGQDMNISQTYAAPLLLNPALTGAYQGNFRLSLLYRDQWSGMIDDPYKSFMISGDARIQMGDYATRSDFVGVGVLIQSDRVNSFDFSTNSITFNGAYHKRLGGRKVNFLSAGLQLGLSQKNFSYENFTFHDQFNGIDDFPFATQEDLPTNNFANFDLSLGLSYSTQLSDELSLEMGLGAYHIIEPEISFYQDVEINQDNMDLINSNGLKQRLSGHVSATIQNGYNTAFTPRITYANQGTHNQIMAGSGVRNVFNDVKSLALHGGIWGRMTHDVEGYAFRDIIFMAGFEFQNVIFGLSYDLSIDDIKTYNAGQHTVEFSIRYIGDYVDKGFYCPQF